MIQIWRGSFSAAHFYRQDQWSAEKNRAEFGKCYSQFGHGHDYRIELTIKLPSQTEIPLMNKLFAEILNKLDHQHLNFVFPEFQAQIPTTENVALYIQNKILLALQGQNLSGDFKILKIRLFETPDLWVEIA